MLHKVAKIEENRNQNLQGPVWDLLKSISSGRTTGVQTNQSFLTQHHGVKFCPQLHAPNFHSSCRELYTCSRGQALALQVEWGVIDDFLFAMFGSVSTASSRGLHSQAEWESAIKNIQPWELYRTLAGFLYFKI